MTLQEQIAAHEALIAEAMAVWEKAVQERDPLVKHKEHDLMRLQSELNALKMRRSV
jgi:hypothetical protein